jgi:hypothetical protein
MKARSGTLSCAYFSGALLRKLQRVLMAGDPLIVVEIAPGNCFKLKPAYPLLHRGRMSVLEAIFPINLLLSYPKN